MVTLKPDAVVEPSARDNSAATAARRLCSPAPPSNNPTRPPTVLRLDGMRAASHAQPTPAHRARRAVPASSSDDSLGVAPVPPIRASARPHAVAPPTEHARPPPSRSRSTSAYDEMRAGKHDAAERGSAGSSSRYPHHDYADNAQYWLGEGYYDQQALRQAAPEFRAVVTRWPTGNKAPDAMLKLGFSLLAKATPTRVAPRYARCRRPIRAPKRRASRRAAGAAPTDGGNEVKRLIAIAAFVVCADARAQNVTDYP